MRALCRRFGADWDGQDIGPLDTAWQNDLLVAALVKAEDLERLKEDDEEED